MKNILLLSISLFIFIVGFSQKNEKEELKIEVNFNGIQHTIQIGDTAHLGYGSLANGNFMYINAGSPAVSLDKQFATKTGIVTKIKYFKYNEQYQIHIKGKFGVYLVEIPQAIDKKEIVGFNKTMFY